MKKQCKWCGKEFEPHHYSTKYCSDKCRHEANLIKMKQWWKKHNPPEEHTFICQVCGKKFKSTHTGRKFCSRECYKEAHWRHRYKRIRHQPRNCDICGKLFTPKSKNSKYCSRKCAEEANRIHARNRRRRHPKVVIPEIYPCYQYSESRITRIPTKMCLNCSAPKCRFEND